MSTCARCDQPARGRFCDTHRREHGARLGMQLDAIIADHAWKVEHERARSAARIPETCGHEPADLRVENGAHFCGRCEAAHHPKDGA